MTTRLPIVQLGRGAIGGTLVGQVADTRRSTRERLGVDLRYVGIAGRQCGVLAPDGLALDRWQRAVAEGPLNGGRELMKAAARRIEDPKILVDATAAENMVEVHLDALAAGFHVVTCNKKPLAGPLKNYRRLHAAARASGRLYLYGVTVGAGLPVLETLRTLIDGGDRLLTIEGCFSGTLNYLCAEMDAGGRFSEVLARARDLGYTEPDPRDDLSGRDVGRKALILAREAGQSIEPEGVNLAPFCVLDEAANVAALPAAAGALDADLGRRWRESAERGARLRFVATVNGGCSASLREVPAGSPLGGLSGPENIFVFTTGRYHECPLVVAGPGAGPEVTAAGALGDILRVARAVSVGRMEESAP